MDNKNYVMVGLSIALLISLGFNAMPEPNYQCDSRELKAYCFSTSSTLKTCYTLPEKAGGKRCTEGWKKIVVNDTEDEIFYEKGGGDWICSPAPDYGCVKK